MGGRPVPTFCIRVERDLRARFARFGLRFHERANHRRPEVDGQLQAGDYFLLRVSW